jgi:lipopolysaccharide biosynthesis glycosyltransferase
MQLSPLPIALCSNDRYFPGLLTTCVSIIISCEAPQPFNFIILDGGISSDNKFFLQKTINFYSPNSSVSYLTPDISRFSTFKKLFGSTLPYARLLLPDLIPLSHVLYIDVDFLFLKDVCKLFDWPLNGSSCLVVQDQIQWQLKSDCPWLDENSREAELPYFNSGLMMIHLDRWRRDRVSETCIRLSMESPDKCTYADQTVLNYVLKNKVEFLDLSWNRRPDKAFLTDEFINDGVNLHYMATKPWQQFLNGPGCPPWYRFGDTFLSTNGDYAADLGFAKPRFKMRVLNYLSSNFALRGLFNGSLKMLGKTWDPSLTTSLPSEYNHYERLYLQWDNKLKQLRK